MGPGTYNGSFQVSFLFTTITSQSKVFQLCSVRGVFFGIGPILLWRGREPRNSDLGASSLDNSELSGGEGEKQNDELYRGGVTRSLWLTAHSFWFYLSFLNLETHLKQHWKIHQVRARCNKSESSEEEFRSRSQTQQVQNHSKWCREKFTNLRKQFELIDCIRPFCVSLQKQLKIKRIADP